MKRRVELNLDLSPVAISGALMHELCRHALDAMPEECCGLLTGTATRRFSSIYRITNVVTKMHLADPDAFTRDAHQAFYMSEVEYMRAQQDAEARGERVTAVYHSHINSGAYLSSEDLSFAAHPLFPFPSASQIVVSILSEQVHSAGIFERRGDSGDFTGRLLEIEG